MKLVYANPLLFDVQHKQNLLQLAGIDAEIRNQYASGALGEVAFVDAWPQLWVADRDAVAAKAVLDAQSNESAHWYCPQCQEENDASFEWCWQCQRERP